MHIAFVPALSWKILTQTILSGDHQYSVWSSNKKEPSHQMSSKQTERRDSCITGSHGPDGAPTCQSPVSIWGVQTVHCGNRYHLFWPLQMWNFKSAFPIKWWLRIQILVSNPKILKDNDKTWVDGREVVSENPATNLWKQSSCTSYLEALAPTRGSQATGLTTKQAGEKLEALSEPVTLASWQVPHVWWLLPHDESNDSRKEQNFFLLVSLPKQVQTRTRAIHSHWPIILKDLSSTRATVECHHSHIPWN